MQWLDERYSLTLLPALSATSGDAAEGEQMETFVRTSSSTVAPPSATQSASSDSAHASLDLTTSCPIFAVKGFCTMGWKCRFLGSHVRVVGPSSLVDETNAAGFAKSGLELVKDEARVEAWRSRSRAFVLPRKATTM